MAHSTNYTNTFITIAADSDAASGRVPPERTRPSAAQRVHAWVTAAPYRFTSDDLLFRLHADKHGIPESERATARAAFFDTPRPCMRANALPKSYGWGVHHDAEGRVALVAAGTDAYERLASGAGPDGPVTVVAAMRSRRR